MPWNEIMMVGKWVFTSDGSGWLGVLRTIALSSLILFLLWLWLLKDTIEPTQHGMRERFGVIKFRYFDGLEDTPELRPRWHQLWRKEQMSVWLKAKRTQWRNSRAAKRFRNSPDGNKPHELRRKFGEPRIYGPGWYTVGPREKGIKIIKLDTRNRVVDLTLYVRMPDSYEVFVLPVQLTVRVADMYLWMQVCNLTEGGILGVVREKSRAILELGYDTIRDDADAVSRALMNAMHGEGDTSGEQPLSSADELHGTVRWYGGEAVFVNAAAPEYQPISMVADALRKAHPQEAENLMVNGSAVTTVMSTPDNAPTVATESAR